VSPPIREYARTHPESVASLLVRIGDWILSMRLRRVEPPPPIPKPGADRTVSQTVTKQSSEWITIRLQRPDTAKAVRRSFFIITMVGSFGLGLAVVMVLSLIGLRLEYSALAGSFAAAGYVTWLTVSAAIGHGILNDLQGLILDAPIHIIISKDLVLLREAWTSGEFRRDPNDSFSLYSGSINTGLFFTNRGINYPMFRYPWFMAKSAMESEDLESLKQLLNSTLRAHTGDSIGDHEQENAQQCGGETHEPTVG
jgi:hypothetical protein